MLCMAYSILYQELKLSTETMLSEHNLNGFPLLLLSCVRLLRACMYWHANVTPSSTAATTRISAAMLAAATLLQQIIAARCA
jgi:cytochrome b561